MFRSTIATTILLSGLAANASAGWTMTTNTNLPSFPAAQTDSCLLSAASASAGSSGWAATGSGYAYDDTPFCDVRVQNNATGVAQRAWSYKAEEGEPKKGWAKASGTVKADGSVTLHTSNSGAVAVGYSLVSSNMFSQVTAELTKSAGETETSIIGELSLEIEGFGATVPITVSTGTGTRPDEDKDIDTGQGCTNFVKIKAKSRAEMEFYADEGSLVAQCDGWMVATASASVGLGVCSEDQKPVDETPVNEKPGDEKPQDHVEEEAQGDGHSEQAGEGKR